MMLMKWIFIASVHLSSLEEYYVDMHCLYITIKMWMIYHLSTFLSARERISRAFSSSNDMVVKRVDGMSC